jgi:non-canonical (house-cleaning) NTP pyrophosphatase
MSQIWVTSESPLKLDVVAQVFPQAEIIPSPVVAPNPPQPVNSAIECAKNRILALVETRSIHRLPDLIISIENGLQVDAMTCADVSGVVMYQPQTDHWVEAISDPIWVNCAFYEEARAKSEAEGYFSPLGIKHTVGEMIQSHFPDIPANNWMADPRFGGIDRRRQMHQAISRAYDLLD